MKHNTRSQFFKPHDWGEKTLQVIIDQYAHQYGPVALFKMHIAHTLHSTKL
jgi:hypothetical protein